MASNESKTPRNYGGDVGLSPRSDNNLSPRPGPRYVGKTVCVIGGGAFGTSMAQVAARTGQNVRLYMRDKAQCDSINEHHVNPKYLSEFELNENIRAFSDPALAIEGADLLILSIPMQTIPEWLSQNRDIIPDDLLVCNTAKGLYLKNGCLLSQMIKTSLGREQPYACLSGPSFAKEIMMGMPTAVMVASKFKYHAVFIDRVMSSVSFRCYTSQDVVGVELGGSLKNPLAIGAGVIEGSGMGINTMSAYITRSSMELQELCQAMGGEPQTISGLAGIGDLMLTGFGALSRNRQLGIRLTKGEKIEDVLKTMTIEGVPTASVAVDFADKCGLEMPIFRSVAALLKGTLSIDDFDLYLLGRPYKAQPTRRMSMTIPEEDQGMVYKTPGLGREN